MSYDLYLYRRMDQPPLDRESFLAAFDVGELWTVEEEAGYSNEATGVYFRFTWYPGGEEDEDIEEPNSLAAAFRTRPYVHFNMNFCRPHFFALEAAVELSNLVRRLELVVDDPQGTIQGEEYSEQGFLDGWNKSNQWATQAIRQLQASGETPLSGSLRRPAEMNRVFWAWNYNREDTSEELLDIHEVGAFVPRIMHYRENDQPRSFCIFPQLVPTAVPRVDRVLITRDQLAEPFEAESKETPAWVTWDELRAACPDYRVFEFDAEDCPTLEYLILYDEEHYPSREEAPEELARWVIALPDWPGRPDIVSPDEILDAELLNA
jgi:hypothetical protein